MKVLITGGLGFIGQWVARALGDAELTAFDLASPKVHADPEAAKRSFPGGVHVADIRDETAWQACERPDVLIHLAAETGTAQSMYEQDAYHSVNVEGTRLAAEAAQRWSVPLVYTSSRAVYGEGRYRNTDGSVSFGAPAPGAVPEDSQETDDHVPVSFYGETKSEAETLITEICDVPTAIVRPQNVVGPGQALHNPYTGVLAAFIARMREGKPLLVYGDGEQTRDFVSVQDTAELIVWLATHPEGHRVVNCGTGVRTTMNDVARFALSGAPDGGHGFEHVDVHRAGDIEHACSDQSHSIALGAPQPKISTEDAIRSYVEWGWTRPGADSSLWDDALDELSRHGLSHSRRKRDLA